MLVGGSKEVEVAVALKHTDTVQTSGFILNKLHRGGFIHACAGLQSVSSAGFFSCIDSERFV